MLDSLIIIEKLSRPLALAKRLKGGVQKIKGMDKYFSSILKDIKEDLIPEDVLGELKKLENKLKQYDNHSVSEKEKIVNDALQSLIRMREYLLEQGFKESRQYLSKDIKYIKGVGPKRGSLFYKKGIKTVEDLLFFIPRRFEQRGDVIPISMAKPGEKCVVKGKVEMVEEVWAGNRKIFEVVLFDGTGYLTLKWFNYNRKYMFLTYKKDAFLYVSGEVKIFRRRKEMIHPEVEFGGEDDVISGTVPIYSEIEGLYKKQLRKIMRYVVDNYSKYILSVVPVEVEVSAGLMDLRTAISIAHFPEEESEKEVEKKYKEARKRIIFEELFILEAGLALRSKKTKEEEGVVLSTDVDLYSKFLSSIPFKLTSAQVRVLKEIETDLSSGTPMNRLLQGDVGSGKTVVAMGACAIAVGNGYQVAVMAPTEILAEQHWRNFKKFLERLNVRICILTSSLKKQEKQRYLRLLRSGEMDIVIGTHALIQEEVEFKNLGLGIIDEQHRFGVVQRAMLRRKGRSPHILVMTATPIPRTLAMTLYGDLDISVIDEMPPGRKPVITKVYTASEKRIVYENVRRIIEGGAQGYVVLPLIEESEKLDLSSAVETYKKLSSGIFSDFNVELLHGRIKQEEREEIMKRFQKGEIHLLISTTVIEVGIDVPNASVMVVDNAERFGLSQLHQLRGRIGRGSEQAYLFLIHSRPISQRSMKRLKIMEETSDGFVIAEKDMELRGPGEVFGTRQWGISDSKMMELLSDPKLLHRARSEAFKVLEGYYAISETEKKMLLGLIRTKWGERLELSKVG